MSVMESTYIYVIDVEYFRLEEKPQSSSLLDGVCELTVGLNINAWKTYLALKDALHVLYASWSAIFSIIEKKILYIFVNTLQLWHKKKENAPKIPQIM